MFPSESLPRRLAAVMSVAAGLGLIGASASGVVALDSQLRAATTHTVPTRLTEDHVPGERDGRCRKPPRTIYRSPEV